MAGHVVRLRLPCAWRVGRAGDRTALGDEGGRADLDAACCLSQDRNAATLARWIMRERPADGRNQAGLLWLLNGDKVVALTETRVNPEFLAFTPGRKG